MKLDAILTEMPRDIPPIDWHYLNNDERNNAQYIEFSKDPYKKVVDRLTDSAIVYKRGSQYFCLDIEHKRITYYMKYEVGNNGKIGQYVWQSLVWINPSAVYIEHYPQKVFFQYLLPKFHSILTDSEQTFDGKRFWTYRIRDALKMNLNVYFYDFDKHNIIPIHNMNEFIKIQNLYDIWGNTNRHELKRILISSKQIPIQRK